MQQTSDPLEADSTTEYEELNSLISSTVFSSITSPKNQIEEETTSYDNPNNEKEDIEWNKLSTLFHSDNFLFFSGCSNKAENCLSVSTGSTSNESQVEISPESSPDTSPYKLLSTNPIETSPLKLSSSSYLIQPSYNSMNKFDDNQSQQQIPYYHKQNSSQKGLDSERSIIYLNNIISKKDKRTTLMIRHIPNKYTLKLFTTEINQRFKNKYDVFYLPIDYVNNCNLGFAFINFVDPLHIVEFYEAFRGKKWKKYYSDKICELAYAKIQGKQNLMVHFEKGSVLNYQTEEKKPLILPTPEKLPKVSLPIKFFDQFKECFPKTPFNYDKEKKNLVFDSSVIT